LNKYLYNGKSGMKVNVSNSSDKSKTNTAAGGEVYNSKMCFTGCVPLGYFTSVFIQLNP
jgi:hypothetical protein